MERCCKQKMQAQAGTITLEMCILFPALFFLWILILWTLFGLYARVLTETAIDHMVLLCQSDEAGGERRGREAVQRIADQSGIGLRIDSLELQRESGFFYTTIQTQMVCSHSLWGKRSLLAQRQIYIVQGTTVRNTLDLIWEIGEELPYTGKLIRDYEEKIERVKNGLGS